LLNSNTFGNGNGGNIQIRAASVSVSDSELTTTVAAKGNAGNISILADDLLELDKSRLFTSLEPGGIGRGGNITIEARDVSLTNFSFIDSATFGQGDAGNVSITADDSVTLDHNSAIFSITSGQGKGGNVRVTAGDAISLANTSNISTAVNATAEGDGGNIDIIGRSLSLTGGSQLITTTSSTGKAGEINVNTTESVIISGVDSNFTLPPLRDIQVTNPPPLQEMEPNDSIDQTQKLDKFSRNHPDDTNPNVEFSTRIPYVSISGTSGGDPDNYSFEVTTAGTRGIFDVDTPSVGGARTTLTLLDSAGNELASNISASSVLGAAGSVTDFDPYLRYVFSEPGIYSIQVNSSRFFGTGTYSLQVSLETPNVARSVDNGVLASGLFARSEGAGVAGNVRINTPELTVFDGGNISATATAAATRSARGGNINVNASQVNLASSSSGLFATTQGVAPAGSLILQPFNNGQHLTINLSDDAQISASTSGKAEGGRLIITAPEAVTLTGNGQLSVETSGAGDGGNIQIISRNLDVQQTQLSTSTTGSGDAGDINLDTSTLNVARGAEIFAFTEGSGDSGTIEINAPTEVNLGIGVDDFSPVLSVETSDAGKAGSIIINTPTLTLSDTARITATATDTATNTEGGGSITLNASTMNLAGIVGVFAETEGQTPAGTLTLNPYQDQSTLDITLAPDSQVSASTSGSGNGGDLILSAPQAITIAGQGRLAVESRSTGNAGNVEVTTRQFTLTDGVELSAAATDSGDAGEVRINTQQLTLENDAKILASNIFSSSEGIILEGLDSLRVSNNSAISASTQTGEAGSLTINANSNPANSVQVSDNSRLSVAATGEGGQAGGLTVNTQQLTLSENSQISASNISGESQDISLQGLENLQLTNGSEISASTQTGTAGSLSINAGENPVESVSLNNSRLSVEATSEGGKAGGVTINTEQLSLSARSQLSASNISGESQDIILQGLENVQLNDSSEISASTQTGTAGSLSVNAGENPVDSVSVSNSRLSVEATSEGGKAGGVTINTQQLSLSEDSQLSASNISGVSQDITLQGLENLQLTDSSEISASTQTGTAGSLNINTGENPVESVSLSNSRLSVEATGERGQAGGVTINTQQLSLSDNSQLSASNVSGESQDITLEGLNTLTVNNSLISASTQTGTAGSLNINVTDSVNLNGVGGLSVAATEGGTAGNLTVKTTQMSVQDEASVTVSSPSGQAGNLTIQANALVLDQSQLTAETGTSGVEGGANISLQNLDTLFMSNESLISAKASGDANGGNIDITTTFLLALPSEGVNGSDIIASAERGDGGRITITGEGIFGIEERPAIEGNRTNDIDASSQFGNSGEIILNVSLDPSRGLTQLPSTLVDPSGQINRTCAASNRQSQFTVTGRGGLPENPTDLFSPDLVQDDFGTVIAREQYEEIEKQADGNNSSISHPPKQIIEAQGWIIDAEGNVVLTAYVPNGTPHDGWQNSVNCQVTGTASQ